MGEPFCWTPDQIGRLTFAQVRCLAQKRPPSDRSTRRFETIEQVRAEMERRRRERAENPWRVGG